MKIYREKIKKTVVITGYRCNNYCRFCMNNNKRDLPDRTTDEIMYEISQARLRGRTYLEVIGGEQTIRPDIIEIIKYAKKMGFSDIVMATNGRLFSYKDFTKQIIAAGLTKIIFSIHGHQARIYDEITQVKGAFRQLRQGIENVMSMGACRVGSNTTICKQNYKYLPEIGRFIYGLGIRNAEFIILDPTRGGALTDFNELVPCISDVAPYARKCLDIAKNHFTEHWHIRYAPFCYFQDYRDQISEIHEKKVFHTEHVAPDFRNFDVSNSRVLMGKVKPKKCDPCKEYEMCEGLWKEYYRRYGDKELNPII